MGNWIVRVVHISAKQEDIQSEDGQGRQLMGKTLQFDFLHLETCLSHISNRFLANETGPRALLAKWKCSYCVPFHFKGSSEKQEDIQSEDGQGHHLMGKTLQFDFLHLESCFSHIFGACVFGQGTVGQSKNSQKDNISFQKILKFSCSVSV